MCKEMRVNATTVKVISKASSLLHLSLTLSSKCKNQTLAPLNGHASLRSAKFFFEGFETIDLPTHLPELRLLDVHVGGWSGFNWYRIEHVGFNYPKLDDLILDCEPRAMPSESSFNHRQYL